MNGSDCQSAKNGLAGVGSGKAFPGRVWGRGCNLETHSRMARPRRRVRRGLRCSEASLKSRIRWASDRRPPQAYSRTRGDTRLEKRFFLFPNIFLCRESALSVGPSVRPSQLAIGDYDSRLVAGIRPCSSNIHLDSKFSNSNGKFKLCEVITCNAELL